VFSFKIGENDVGDVHVMSTPFVIQHKFVQALGEYCFRMPREFTIFGEPEVSPDFHYSRIEFEFSVSKVQTRVLLRVGMSPQRLPAVRIGSDDLRRSIEIGADWR
jgi:hypothetical protein